MGRRRGKWGYFAPEQFGPEWEYLTEPGAGLGILGPEVSEQPIAGNYGSPMNLWGVALVILPYYRDCWSWSNIVIDDVASYNWARGSNAARAAAGSDNA